MPHSAEPWNSKQIIRRSALRSYDSFLTIFTITILTILTIRQYCLYRIFSYEQNTLLIKYLHDYKIVPIVQSKCLIEYYRLPKNTNQINQMLFNIVQGPGQYKCKNELISPQILQETSTSDCCCKHGRPETG